MRVQDFTQCMFIDFSSFGFSHFIAQAGFKLVDVLLSHRLSPEVTGMNNHTYIQFGNVYPYILSHQAI